MQNELNKVRFSVKPLKSNDNKVVELARTVGIHPLAYQELPYDPEYSFYAGRLNPEVLSHATADEMYWKVRQEVIFRHTGEHPYEISGPDAEKLLQKIFTRDISKVKVGRCSYQFACYNDGGMLTDGVLLKLEENKFWFVQADGDLFSWYKAHTDNLNVKISDPDVWVSQIQGPKSMDLLKVLSKETFPENWKYFDWKEITILNEKVIISRSGFSNELGWEIYFRKNNNTEKVGDYILEEGKKMRMILTGTPGFRCKRIESGLLSAGQDFNHETNPYDVGLGKYVDLKKNYFIGKSALMTADKEKREKIDLKNQAETLVYQTEKQLGELGDKIDAAAKSKVEEKSNALKEATSKEDYESMKKLLEELQQELYAVGSSVYQQPGNQPPSPGAAGGPDQSDSNEKGGDDVIDADFTETKD